MQNTFKLCQTDYVAVAEMQDVSLKDYIPKHGDRIAKKKNCKCLINDKVKLGLLDKLQEKNEAQTE